MKPGFFVTGTDTGVGKTLVSCALLHALSETGKSVAGMKPVAAGGDDATWLMQASSVSLPRKLANPWALDIAASPNISANLAGLEIGIGSILDAYREIEADVVIVEGIGGFMVPLNATETLSDLAKHLAIPVILVVGMRLGCITHALLTQAAVRAAGLELAGWVANSIDPGMDYARENIL